MCVLALNTNHVYGFALSVQCCNFEVHSFELKKMSTNRRMFFAFNVYSQDFYVNGNTGLLFVIGSKLTPNFKSILQIKIKMY